MDVKILVEPLRERLFILTEEGSLTYADSRAIIVCSFIFKPGRREGEKKGNKRPIYSSKIS